MIPVQAGHATATTLSDLGFDVTWRTYAMPHAVCPEEIRDLGDWFDRRFARLSMEPAPGEPWLPDLCRLGRLATMLGVAELVVAVIALAPLGRRRMDARALRLGQCVRVVARAHRLGGAVRLAPSLVAHEARDGRDRRGACRRADRRDAARRWCTRSIAAWRYGLVPETVRMHRFVGGSAAIATLIVAVVLRYLYAVDGWQAQVRASARAEADALQARIKPHFLFNSMNTIAGLVRRDPDVAERAVLDLSDLFRAALGAGQGESSLAEEVELAERYLSIEQLRLGERLQVRWRGATSRCPGSCRLPRLVLQPLVENAVLHGISRLPAGGTIDIELAMRPDGLHRQRSQSCTRRRRERD